MTALSSLRSPLDAYVDYRLRLERVAVEDPWRYQLMPFTGIAKALLLCLWFALFLIPAGGDLGTRFIIAAGTGFVIFSAASAARLRADAYFDGYMDGRSQLIASLHEAQRREMEMSDWLSLELERQGLMMIQRHGPRLFAKALTEVDSPQEGDE